MRRPSWWFGRLGDLAIALASVLLCWWLANPVTAGQIVVAWLGAAAIAMIMAYTSRFVALFIKERRR